VRTLESAQAIPETTAGTTGWSPELSWTLAEYRWALRPDLASYASIDAALDLPERAVLIPEGARWKYFRGTREPSEPVERLEWTQAGFDDAAWEEGPGSFGSSKVPDRRKPVATSLPDMRGGYRTLYVRHAIQVADPASIVRLRLLVYADDGFVAYLNGKEVGRFNAGAEGKAIHHDGAAAGGSDGSVPVQVWIEGKELRRGANCLAIQGLNGGDGKNPFYLDAMLDAERAGDPARIPALLDGLRAAAKGDGARSRVAYMEGRVLQREGKLKEAAAKFREVVAQDKSRPEPSLRLAECLRALGEEVPGEEVPDGQPPAEQSPAPAGNP
jgi:hypothetical protein